MPIVQRECNIFVKQWNSHRIRVQEKLELPTGIPEHMFSFPEYYQGTKEGVGIPAQYLEEVAQLSGTMDADIENRGLMEEGFRQSCENFLLNSAEISAKDAIEGYRFLKFKLSNN